VDSLRKLRILLLLSLLVVSGFTLVYGEENQITSPYSPEKFVSGNPLHPDSAPLMHSQPKVTWDNMPVSATEEQSQQNQNSLNPDNLSFRHVSSKYLPKAGGQDFSDPLTKESVTLKSGHYIMYPSEKGHVINSEEKQLLTLSEENFYLVPHTLDKNANLAGILLLAIPFGLFVYRMSDEDPIPLKYSKLSGVVVIFTAASLMTMPLAIGNSFWQYAYATDQPQTDIPKPTDSIYFDSLNNISLKFSEIISDKENSALYLDGETGFVMLNSSLPEKLDYFSVSAWVKPDFKKGAPSTLAIVSEADAFELAINNDKIEKSVAIFSVFDGIKWHKIQSNSAIPEIWTHISATYDDGEIKLFVNGIHENYKKIDPSYSLTYQYGDANQNSYDHILSNGDVLIGAFNPSIREKSEVENHFSGLVDDVALYDKSLSLDQISQIHQIKRIPDIFSESESQPVKAVPEATGTPNEYGFVADDDNPNDQNIEESASSGYKVKKPEDKKNPEEQSTSNSKDSDNLQDRSKAESLNQPLTNANPNLQISPTINDFDYASVNTSSHSDIEQSEIIITENIDDDSQNATSQNNNTSNQNQTSQRNNNVPTSVTPDDRPPPESTKTPATEDLDEFSNVEITTSSDSSVASKSTDNISDFILDHLPIEIGKEVKWQQTVTFTEEAQFAEIEVPMDAEFTSVSKLDGVQIPLDSISDVLEISSASFRATLSDHHPDLRQEDSNTKLISIPNPSNGVVIEFTTSPPGLEEQLLKHSSQSFEKHVTVSHNSALHYSNVLTQSDIPEDVFDTASGNNLRLLWIDENGQKIDVTNNPQYAVNLVDTDANGKYDGLKWNVPQLSEQSFVILITTAEYLDSDRNFIADVYDLVSEIDNLYLNTTSGEYIRTTFEVPISNVNYIDVVAKTTDGISEGYVEIYQVDSNELIATIGPITVEKMYSAKLLGLSGSQDVFDLRVSGASLDINYIQDAAHLIPFDVSNFVDYIGLAYGPGGDGNAIAWSNYEVGANKNFVPGQGGACIGPDLTGNPTLPANTASVYQGKAFTAGIGVTSDDGSLNLSNMGVYSSFGIRMTNNPDSGRVNLANSYYNDPNDYPNEFDGTSCTSPVTPAVPEMTVGGAGFNGTWDFTATIADLFGAGGAKAVIPTLTSTGTLDLTGTSGKIESTTFTINLNSGMNIIDVNTGGDKFLLSSSNLVFNGTSDSWVIMRMPVPLDVTSSNILIGDGGISPTSVLFYFNTTETATVLVSSGILNGISFWSLNQNKDEMTFNNAQGCASAISSKINFNDVRLVRCAFGDDLSGDSIDLSLTKVSNETSPDVGDNINYTITVTNEGPSNATGVLVEDVLPSGVSYVSHYTTTGTYSDDTGNWTIGDINVGETKTLQITVEVLATGDYTNIAQVIDAGQNDIDSTPDNDVPTEDDQDNSTITPQVADLSLTKVSNETSPDVGTNINYTITVTNAGPSNATGVLVEDVLPTGVSYVSSSGDGTYSNTTGTWNIGQIDYPGSATLEITATVLATGDYTNIAQVNATDQFDPDSTPDNDVPTEDDQDNKTTRTIQQLPHK
jgi:uncharacterized repeat protein (TIGR01451 family)